MDPDAPYGLEHAIERAELLDETGRTREGLDLLLPLLAQAPGDPDLLRACARLLQSTGDPADADEGVRLLRQAVAAEPDDPEALCLLGLALSVNPVRWREARRLTGHAVEVAPLDAATWLAHAQVLKDTVAKRGPTREAAEQAVALAPQSAAAALLLAEVAHDQTNPFDKRQVAATLALVQRALELDPHDPDAHVLRAKADYDAPSSRRQEAYLEAARLDPSRHDAIVAFDDELTFPLRIGFWLMTLLVVVQGGLIAVEVDLGTLLGLLALLVVLPLAWVGFLVVRKESPDDPAREPGVDPLLVGMVLCLLFSVPLFRLSTRVEVPWVGWAGCVLALLLSDALYRTRRRRRRKRFGG